MREGCITGGKGGGVLDSQGRHLGGADARVGDLAMGQRGVLGRLDDVGKVRSQENMAHLRNVGDCVVVGAELTVSYNG